MSARFGTPAGIDPLRLFALPPPERRMGALMLLDMGMSEARARRHLGLSIAAFNEVLHGTTPPLRRGGETDLAGDHA